MTGFAARPSRLLPVLAAAVLWLAGCAVNPVTGRSDFVLMSEEDEIALGREAHPQILKQYGGRYDDPGLQAYVQQVGERLAARSHRSNLVYRFTVLDSQEVNAFALPGGYIYITRGLLAYLDSEAELGAVLGHEIGHVTARHAVRQISGARAAELGYTIGSIFLPELRTQAAQNLFNILGSAIISGYGREHELEADRLGAEYLARSGYDPKAMIEVIGVLKDQEEFERQLAEEEGREPRVYHGVFATHPSNDRRLQEVIASVGEQAVEQVEINREAFLGHLDGLVFGAGENEGVLRGRAFYHRPLGIGFRFPEGWKVENLPDRLVATPRDGRAVLQVTVEDINRRIPPREFMLSRLKLKGLRDGEALRPAGLEGYTALVERRTGFGRRLVRFSVIFHDDRAFVFAGTGKARDDLPRYDPLFLEVARSFHPLTPEEERLARALRIGLIKAREGMRFADLARDSPLHSHAEAQLRLLNQLYPDGEPTPGMTIKIVR